MRSGKDNTEQYMFLAAYPLNPGNVENHLKATMTYSLS